MALWTQMPSSSLVFLLFEGTCARELPHGMQTPSTQYLGQARQEPRSPACAKHSHPLPWQHPELLHKLPGSTHRVRQRGGGAR